MPMTAANSLFRMMHTLGVTNVPISMNFLMKFRSESLDLLLLPKLSILPLSVWSLASRLPVFPTYSG